MAVEAKLYEIASAALLSKNFADKQSGIKLL